MENSIYVSKLIICIGQRIRTVFNSLFSKTMLRLSNYSDLSVFLIDQFFKLLLKKNIYIKVHKYIS